MTTVSEIFETMAYGPAPESDKPALEWIAGQNGAFGLFIGGRWTKGKSDAGFDVINPATTARLARVTQAGQADVDSAVAAARKAFPAWAALSGHARARLVRPGARRPKAFSPAGGAREPRQREVDSRDARSRHPARGASPDAPCRVGPARGV